MTCCVGVDLGSHWIKAASHAGDGIEKILQLAPGQGRFGLPFVIRDGDELGSQWDQYATRRSDFSVGFGFRDRVWDAATRFRTRRKVLQGRAGFWKPVCAGMRHAVSTAVSPLDAIGLSVPNSWCIETPWALGAGPEGGRVAISIAGAGVDSGTGRLACPSQEGADRQRSGSLVGGPVHCPVRC